MLGCYPLNRQKENLHVRLDHVARFIVRESRHHVIGGKLGVLTFLAAILRQIGVAYALTSMSEKRPADKLDSAIHMSVSGLWPNELFFVVNGRVRKPFPLRCGSV